MIRGEFSSEDGERRVLSGGGGGGGGGELESARNAGASREPLSSPQWVSVSSWILLSAGSRDVTTCHAPL